MSSLKYCLLSCLLIVFSVTPCRSDTGNQLEIFVQLGHLEEVSALTFSSDGSLILSGSEDYTMKLWDVATGREIRTFRDDDDVLTVALSSDGRFSLSGNRNSTMRLLDSSNGAEIRSFENCKPIGFTPDDRSIAYADREGVHVWEISQNRKIINIPFKLEKHDSFVLFVMSPDGKYILAGTFLGKILLFDLNTGIIAKTFEGHYIGNPVGRYLLGESPNEDIKALAFRQDGRTFWSASDDGTMRLWDLSSGAELKSFQREATAFSQDAKYAFLKHGNDIDVIDPETNAVIRTLQKSEEIEDDLAAFALSPDGRQILFGYENGLITLNRFDTGEILRKFGTRANPVKIRSAVFSYDGSVILCGYEDRVRVWEPNSSRVIRTFQEIDNIIYSAVFTPDDNKVLTGNAFCMRLWDFASGDTICSLKGYQTSVFEIAVSPDGRLAVGVDDYGILKVWDLEKLREIRSFASYQDEIKHVIAVDFQPDSHSCLTMDYQGLNRWDVYSGTKTLLFENPGNTAAVEWSPNKRHLVTGSSRLKLLDAFTGVEIQEYDFYSSTWPADIAFSPDGQFFVTAGGGHHDIQLFSLNRTDEIRRYRGHADYLNSVAYSPDGGHLVSSSGDKTVRIWDVNTGHELAQLIVFEDNEWLVITPEGFYDSSARGYQNINVTIGRKAYNIDQFFDDFYRPGLLAEVLKGREFQRSDINLADKLNVSPPPFVKITSPNDDQTFTQKEIEVTVKCIDNGGGIEDVRLYHNDKLVNEDSRGVKVVSQDFVKTFQVLLLNGENRLKATAFSSGRIEARPDEIMVLLQGMETEASSTIFVIGIDQYKNSVYNLNFARADAYSVKDLIQSKSGGLFQNIIIHELYDTQATADAIQSIFQTVVQQIQPQDVFTFFYAGHGVMLSDEDGKEQFYLIPSEVTNMYSEDKVQNLGISGKALVDWSRNIPARKQLFIIDACQAGSLSETFALRGAAEQKALAQLARSAGVHVVASTGSEQFAAEFQELGHGLFTFTLLQAIQGAADGTPKDGRITVREINAYLENAIPDLSEKYRGQPQYPVIFSKGQDFPVVVE